MTKQFCHNKIYDTKTGPEKPKGEGVGATGDAAAPHPPPQIFVNFYF